MIYIVWQSQNRGGKQTIDPPIPSCVENVIRGDDEVVDDNGE